jgi:hypothetical protein
MEAFMEIFGEITNFVIYRGKYWAVCMKTEIGFIAEAKLNRHKSVLFE